MADCFEALGLDMLYMFLIGMQCLRSIPVYLDITFYRIRWVGLV